MLKGVLADGMQHIIECGQEKNMYSWLCGVWQYFAPVRGMVKIVGQANIGWMDKICTPIECIPPHATHNIYPAILVYKSAFRSQLCHRPLSAGAAAALRPANKAAISTTYP